MIHAITLRSVPRRFGDLITVDDLSFDVWSGEIFGLPGPSGAGKITAIHLITGLLRRDSGDVRVLGFDPESEPRQELLSPLGKPYYDVPDLSAGR